MALEIQTPADSRLPETTPLDPESAEAIMRELASILLAPQAGSRRELAQQKPAGSGISARLRRPPPEFIYRLLVEQIPAVLFIAYLEEGKSQAYVSPQIEATLGFSQEEWIDDPILWYQQLHPEDKTRWSLEAANMFFSGEPLKSAYRVLSREGRVVWFQCEAKMVRHPEGEPWFILGVGFEITELKATEQALKERTESLRRLSTTLLESQDHERRRIARELHDGIGQCLVALKLNFEMLTAVQDHRELWAESTRLLDQCLQDTRNLSYLLHPPLLDDAGLLLATKAYVEGFSKRSGIEARLKLPDQLPAVSKAVELVIFRVLQESLTNVIRHSGSKRVEIHLASDITALSLRVADWGRGIPSQLLHQICRNVSPGGVGLVGIRERVTELGGRFEINSNASGTQVEVVLPLASDQPKPVGNAPGACEPCESESSASSRRAASLMSAPGTSRPKTFVLRPQASASDPP